MSVCRVCSSRIATMVRSTRVRVPMLREDHFNSLAIGAPVIHIGASSVCATRTTLITMCSVPSESLALTS